MRSEESCKGAGDLFGIGTGCQKKPSPDTPEKGKMSGRPRAYHRSFSPYPPLGMSLKGFPILFANPVGVKWNGTGGFEST